MHRILYILNQFAKKMNIHNKTKKYQWHYDYKWLINFIFSDIECFTFSFQSNNDSHVRNLCFIREFVAIQIT